ncbi:flavodoxin [Methanomicrobium sp. W14]|uniref:flavodoxin family protein n=1 Tax=Methanomicrobium sp. W14 TaxID=2817839 RepID=UPI001AE9B93A|nr:flavodoxin [Methanomicrobium sp. W14]MBP2134237.1 flavodoxin [Methanomicrobium sp. W14]
MKAAVIYHSFSGVTRGVAEKVNKALEGDLIEVKPVDSYSKLTAYTVGTYRARKGEADKITPETIEVSGYDIIVIGTPVWAFRPTPAINAAVKGLTGCAGKRAVIFATCGGSAKDTTKYLTDALSEKHVTVFAEFVLDKNDVLKDENIERISESVVHAGESE